MASGVAPAPLMLTHNNLLTQIWLFISTVLATANLKVFVPMAGDNAYVTWPDKEPRPIKVLVGVIIKQQQQQQNRWTKEENITINLL